MRIAGMIALQKSPFWRQTYEQLEELCDDIYVRFDMPSGDPEILQELHRMQDMPNSKLRSVAVISDRWRCPQWREECLYLINGADVKPDIVICPDEDEIFAEGIKDALKAFYDSGKGGMMFDYHPLATDDGRAAGTYPEKPHMKAFRWKEGISYHPYHGDGRIAAYANERDQYKSNVKIIHFAAYTKAMQASKNWRQRKCVTLVGFGPSAGNNIQVVGEVWGLNNCYEVYPQNLMKATTRIFEMHQFGKRDKIMAKDGVPHFAHLDQLGKLGHRIVMQAPHPNITNSEAWPLQQMCAKYPRFYTGTPAYMLASAVDEGYTEIRLYGFDQQDWEHILQRESFVFWVGMALGKGIAVSGNLTFLDRAPRLYGYDYGPEFDEECERALWSGFPFQIHSKVESRAVVGDLYGHRK